MFLNQYTLLSRHAEAKNTAEKIDKVAIQNTTVPSTEDPSGKDAKKMSRLKDTEDKSLTIFSHILPSLKIDINEDMNTDELNRGDSNVINGNPGSFDGGQNNKNELNISLGVSISSQVHHFLFTFKQY